MDNEKNNNYSSKEYAAFSAIALAIGGIFTGIGYLFGYNDGLKEAQRIYNDHLHMGERKFADELASIFSEYPEESEERQRKILHLSRKIVDEIKEDVNTKINELVEENKKNIADSLTKLVAMLMPNYYSDKHYSEQH